MAVPELVTPTAAILSASYMLNFLGKPGPAENLESAVESTIAAGDTTPDLGGDMGTMDMAQAVLARVYSNE